MPSTLILAMIIQNILHNSTQEIQNTTVIFGHYEVIHPYDVIVKLLKLHGNVLDNIYCIQNEMLSE